MVIMDWFPTILAGITKAWKSSHQTGETFASQSVENATTTGDETKRPRTIGVQKAMNAQLQGGARAGEGLGQKQAVNLKKAEAVYNEKVRTEKGCKRRRWFTHSCRRSKTDLELTNASTEDSRGDSEPGIEITCVLHPSASSAVNVIASPGVEKDKHSMEDNLDRSRKDRLLGNLARKKLPVSAREIPPSYANSQTGAAVRCLPDNMHKDSTAPLDVKIRRSTVHANLSQPQVHVGGCLFWKRRAGIRGRKKASSDSLQIVGKLERDALPQEAADSLHLEAVPRSGQHSLDKRRQLLELARSELSKIETENELCWKESTYLIHEVKQEVQAIMEAALGAVQGGGDVRVINEAIRYNDELLSVKRESELLVLTAGKIKADLVEMISITMCTEIIHTCLWRKGLSYLRGVACKRLQS